VKEAKLKVATMKEKAIEIKVLCSWCVDYTYIYIVFTIIICLCYYNWSVLSRRHITIREKFFIQLCIFFQWRNMMLWIMDFCTTPKYWPSESGEL